MRCACVEIPPQTLFEMVSIGMKWSYIEMLISEKNLRGLLIFSRAVDNSLKIWVFGFSLNGHNAGRNSRMSICHYPQLNTIFPSFISLFFPTEKGTLKSITKEGWTVAKLPTV